MLRVLAWTPLLIVVSQSFSINVGDVSAEVGKPPTGDDVEESASPAVEFARDGANAGYQNARHELQPSMSSTTGVSDEGTITHWKEGDKIQAFFRLPSAVSEVGHGDHEEKNNYWYRALPVVKGSHQRHDGAVIGWAESWLPAEVVNASDPSNIAVAFEYPHWLDWSDGWEVQLGSYQITQQVSSNFIRPRSSRRAPLLSLIVVRWGDLQKPCVFNREQEVNGAPFHPGFVAEALNSVLTMIGTEYEILSVWVRNTGQLKLISEHLLLSACTGEHVAAATFLWPSPNRDTSWQAGGYVYEADYWDFQKRLERAGIPIIWPHSSHFYEIIPKKSWVPMLSVPGNPYNLPVTVVVPRTLWAQSPWKAAKHTLELLSDRTGVPAEDLNVIAKMYGMHEARGVISAKGSENLSNALNDLFPMYPDHNSIFLQPKVQGVRVEARVWMVHGHIAHVTWTRFANKSQQEHTVGYEYFTGLVEIEREQVVEQQFDGDQLAVADAERQFQELTDKWWVWLSGISGEPLVSVRLDFLVTHEAPGKAGVWSLEIGEQGVSFSHWTEGLSMVWTEVIKTFLSWQVD